MGEPAKQLKKLDRMIGHFEGSGTVNPGAGIPAMKWTSTSHCKKVLDGHFLQEETIIDLGEGAPAPIAFRTLFGWDASKQRYVSAAIGNMGPAKIETVHFVDDDTMVTTGSAYEEGEFVVERWVTKFTKDGYTFSSQRAIADGKFETYVTGTVKRVKAAARGGVAVNATASFAPVPKQMTALAKLAGTYSFKGSMQMDASMPEIPISGTEKLTTSFGGNIVEGWVDGDPVENMGTYKAWFAFCWDPNQNCYVQLYANNMGEIGESHGYRIGNDFVFTMQGLQNGLPALARTIVKCDENGTVTKSLAHSIVGANDPLKMFKATYTKK
jgi:hypothetical protein